MGTVRTDEFRKDAVRIALSSIDQKTVWATVFPTKATQFFANHGGHERHWSE